MIPLGLRHAGCAAWLAVVGLLLAVATGGCSRPVATVAESGCAALKQRVAAIPGDGALLLRSYDGEDGAAPSQPALATAAFVYDESLAVIALLACDAAPQALRIGEALRLAASTDTRLRNVYRAGAVDNEVLRNGWWDDTQQRWVEDPYQAGTSTGNVAWAGLAMLALHEATRDSTWLDTAKVLGRWIVDNQADSRGAGGFRGGLDGFDDAPAALAWKSTEHALDLVALFDGLAARDANVPWSAHAAAARAFVESQWDESGGYFGIGTEADGVTGNRQSSALDVQLWAQLVRDPSPQWRQALDYAERAHAVDCGFDFNADRDGIWLEGTAQAALAYRLLGNDAAADRALACVQGQFAPGGLVHATREPRVSTGLAADAYYFRMPHLGATAWATLAALGRNPYDTGR